MTGVGIATREQVAAEVRAAAARQRVTQRSLAAALGISQQALSRRWTGELPFETDLLAEVGNLLGMDPREFFPDPAAVAVASSMLATPLRSVRKPPKKTATRANKVYCSTTTGDNLHSLAEVA